MIPKKIHLIYLSSNTLPDDVEECVITWKQHEPNAEIIHWTYEKCKDIIDSAPLFVKKCYENKLYAITADYLRIYLVYKYGGWYLDSDCIVVKPFIDKYSNFNFISSIEETKQLYNGLTISSYNNVIFKYGIGINAAMFGGEIGNKLCELILKCYESDIFNNYFNDIYNCITLRIPIAPQIYAYCAEELGFIYYEKNQMLKNNTYLDNSGIFSNVLSKTKNTHVIHICKSHWLKDIIKKLYNENGQS